MEPRDTELERAIEAILMASTEPVEPSTMAQLLEVPRTRVEAAVDDGAAPRGAENARRGGV